jgi:peroxiredoxin
MTEYRTPRKGEIAPDFELPDTKGVMRRLSSIVSTRQHVLVFFRGDW